jgi:hypothetical protein
MATVVSIVSSVVFETCDGKARVTYVCRGGDDEGTEVDHVDDSNGSGSKRKSCADR